MSPLDTKHTVRFDAPATTDIVLKTPKIPGLEVRIPKGSVVRDEKGRPVTELGITAIPIDRPPFPLPKNSVIPVYFTVQPGGTYVFPKGAEGHQPLRTGRHRRLRPPRPLQDHQVRRRRDHRPGRIDGHLRL
ncbi:hypothetical protein ACWGI8_10105 [Streptomyces sp. NPDC054841]